jgi:predicted dehydrogenase
MVARQPEEPLARPPLRVGLIGCGGIGKLRAQALDRSEAARLTVVSDLDRRRAESLARIHQARVEADWRALVRREDVDAVVVSTPPDVHAEMCIEALRCGRHVLCEKPLARSAAECKEIVAAADGHGRFLACGFNYRFYPSIQKARELLDSGTIGDLDHIRSYTGYSAAEHGQAWLHDPDIMGGGALRDNGIHLIDLTRYFLGEAVEAQGCASGSVWRFPGCEDNGFLLLRNARGNVASVQASWTEWRKYRLVLDIYGSRGAIRASCFPMLVDVVSAAERGGRTRRRRFLFPVTFVMEHLRTYRWVVVQSFVEEFQAFALAASGRTPGALATGHDGWRAVAIAEAADPPMAPAG